MFFTHVMIFATTVIGSHPQPVWYTPEVIMRKNIINTSLTTLFIVIGLLFLIAGLKRYKKHHKNFSFYSF